MIKRFLVKRFLQMQERHNRVSAEMEKRAAAQCERNAHQFAINAYLIRMKIDDLSL